jgi:hypothetical protein
MALGQTWSINDGLSTSKPTASPRTLPITARKQFVNDDCVRLSPDHFDFFKLFPLQNFLRADRLRMISRRARRLFFVRNFFSPFAGTSVPISEKRFGGNRASVVEPASGKAFRATRGRFNILH